MIKTILLFLLLLPLSANAVNFAVLGAKSEVLWSATSNVRLPRNAGAVSVEFFKKGLSEGGISAFDGNENGIISVNNLGSNVKVISEDETEYYQWCFTINDFQPSNGPKETILADQNTKVTWYYAFSLLRQGEWVRECVPADQSKLKN